MMNILFLNHNVVGRSTFHRCMGFARELVLLGNRVTVITNSEKEKIRFRRTVVNGVEIIESPDLLYGTLRTGWDVVNVIRRCLYLRGKKFDLVHAFDCRPTVILPALFYIRFIKKVPLVIDWADWWGRGGAIKLRKNKFFNSLFSPVETFFEEYFRKFADYSTVTSNLLAKRALGLGINSKRLMVIFSGADVVNIYPENKINSRKLLNLPHNAHVCIFSGYVLYDLKVILEAFKQVIMKDPEAILLLIGNFQKRSNKDISLLMRSQKIKLVNNADRKLLRTCLSASDIALLPLSDNLANKARFPIKFGDYLASGINIITNNVGDIGKILKENSLGYLVNYTPEAYAKKIMEIFRSPQQNKNDEQRRLLFARRYFSWKIFSMELSKVYKKLVI